MADSWPGTRNVKVSLNYPVPKSKEIIKKLLVVCQNDTTRKGFPLAKSGII